MSQRHNIHATGIVLGAAGLMLRGPSGAGKSLLALALLDTWEDAGRRARLVADDRLDLELAGHDLVMHAPPAIAGLVELRGRGIVRRPHLRKARCHLVVDLVPDYERMVEEDALQTGLFGVSLPRCPVPRAGVIELGHQVLLVREALRSLSTASGRSRQKIT